ncbi:sensor domain-containing diguanylate cyclase [Sphingomonas sp. RB3P16]|uniref:sensor domain-containing diguanylate cyclase n=1 Tax=Parasphingomonas frigoris TaxID=3096163 RepID=UPI002FCBF328
MRLATITNWAYGITVTLTLASGATMLAASHAQDDERAAVEQRYRLDKITSTLDEDATQLSELARQFALSGNTADKLAYSREQNTLGKIESRTTNIRDAGASEGELADLHGALKWTDALRPQQQAAIVARQTGDRARAVEILFSTEYERELDRVQAAIRSFQDHVDERTSATLQVATSSAKLLQGAAEVMLSVTALLFLCVLFFVFRQRVLRPVVKLSDVVTRLAAHDYEAVPPNISQVDEIGDMAEALRIFRATGIERQRLERERDADRAMRDLMSRMTQRMQSCDSIDDLKDVARRFLPEIAPRLAGCLYFLDTAKDAMVEAVSWQDPRHSTDEFSLLSCWAIRRGTAHRPAGDQIDVPCGHLDASDGTRLPDTICLPLTGQQGTLGLLYLEPLPGGALSELPDIYLEMLAENIGLSLDNLRLREALHAMAMADALTTLANRRQLDAVLEAELDRSARSQTEISCIMADIDHFKRFNDEVGHEAGDAVLRAVGGLLKGLVRESDLVFRYGGEEFLLLLPGVAAEEAVGRAEKIRSEVSALRVQHRGNDLGAVTISLGVSTAPAPNERAKLVQAADAALLRAKRQGRDRVVSSGPRVEQKFV